MSYLCKRIDARGLDEKTYRQVCECIETYTTIHDADLAHPGVLIAFFQEEELAILENPIFRDCIITNA